jgi:nucleoside 2-deoxyribosyltransferase
VGDRRAVYLAGPLGFSPATRLYHDTVLRPAVEQTGWVVLDPWDADPDEAKVWAAERGSPSRVGLDQLVRRVAARNAEMIERAEAVLAVLDGTDVDSGTASEIGYAAAKGKRVVGLRLDTRLTGDCEVVSVNLQVEYFIKLNGGVITRSLGDAIAALGDPE